MSEGDVLEERGATRLRDLFARVLLDPLLERNEGFFERVIEHDPPAAGIAECPEFFDVCNRQGQMSIAEGAADHRTP